MGKTTAAQYLVDNFGYKRYSFAQKLKDICVDMGWMPAGTKDRKLLQEFGTDVMRHWRPNVWVDYLVYKITNDNPEYATVDDCRFINEADALRKIGFTIVRMVNKSGTIEAAGLSSTTSQHASELESDQIQADMTIIADSLDDMYHKLNILLNISDIKLPQFPRAKIAGTVEY